MDAIFLGEFLLGAGGGEGEFSPVAEPKSVVNASAT
jgi:hypothetical protein